MPVMQHAFRYLPLDEIFVERPTRQRKVVSTAGLIDSIRERGVLQPIIVTAEKFPDPSDGLLKHRLMAGERRLTCCLQLQINLIPAMFREDLSPIEAQIIELEENIKRDDLCWQDIVRSVATIHRLYLGLDPEWTMGETASSVGLSPGIISMYLKVHLELESERVREAGTVREAYNMLSRRDSRAAGDALQELISGPLPAQSTQAIPTTASVTEGKLAKPSPKPIFSSDPAKTILHESFLHWAPKYSGQPFNLLHCDFPYGIGLFSSNGLTSGPNRSQMGQNDGKYEDSPDLYFRLIEALCSNLDRLMSMSSHLMFWFSEKHRDGTMRAFKTLAPSLAFWPFPLIWLKSDNVGIASDTRHGPRHIYESCLLASRGNRQIVKVVADAYSASTDKRYHVSTKPEQMLRHFMGMLVDNHTRLLDPTCGSGAAIRAAESLNASYTLGMDIDEQTVGTARMVLKQARTLRGAGQIIG